MMKTEHLTVREEDEGKRLDLFLSEQLSISRSRAARYAENGNATLAGEILPKKALLKKGNEIILRIPEPKETETAEEDIPLDVVYEDDDIIVINKPSGMVVHPAAGNEEGTLVNALLHHCKGSLSGIGGEIRPGIVHRIDKDTSGLLVVAKNDAAHLSLSAQIKVHDAQRIYSAIVRGNFREENGTIDRPIGRHPKDRKKMAVYDTAVKDKHIREAVTHYHVLERFDGFSYLSFRLETGRTHQIRVHTSYMGHPILGDEVYGGMSTPFERKHQKLFCGQMLHASELLLTHPVTGEKMHFSCPLPPEFEEILTLLRQQQT